MSRRVEVVWDDDLTQYNFGRGHPMAPVRVELTMRLARAHSEIAGMKIATMTRVVAMTGAVTSFMAWTVASFGSMPLSMLKIEKVQ